MPDSPLLIRNIGTIVSGVLEEPFAAGDAILCSNGRIEAVGALADVHPGGSIATLDAAGHTVTPGLIDPHTHPVLGDYTPRHSAAGWIESYLHGGVTTMISAGEPHTPGRPRDAAGVMALALLAHKSYTALRPAGVKMHAGALLLEPGLVEEDFRRLAAQGCWLIGEIGISGVTDPGEARLMRDWAKSHGFIVPVHVGGASVPGSSVIGAEFVLAVEPDVALHCNGGPTAPSFTDVLRIIDEGEAGIEVVQAGNIAMLQRIVRELAQRDAIGRLQIGSDTPSGTGVIPLAMLRTIAYVSALGGLRPEQAIAQATGSTASRYGLDVGRIAVGSPADLVILSAALGSAAGDALGALEVGDTPAVAGVVIDGALTLTRSRVSPPPRTPVLLEAAR